MTQTDVPRYALTLFVNGASDLSSRVITNARLLCELHLGGRYQLSVVDLRDEPGAAADSRVLAAPTLVRNRPLPVRRHVGDMAHTARVLKALGLPDAAAG